MVFPICHSIATLIASHGTDQFEAYLQAMKTAEELVRRGTTLQYLTAEVKDTKTEEAQQRDHEECSACISENSCPSLSPPHKNLKFRRKLQSRGRPKRSVRQLCSFNKSQADRGLQTDKKKPRKQENTESLNRQRGVKKRRILGSNDNCPVCDERPSHTDPDVVTTDCCSTLIHDDCSLEFSDCPQCNELCKFFPIFC